MIEYSYQTSISLLHPFSSSFIIWKQIFAHLFLLLLFHQYCFCHLVEHQDRDAVHGTKRCTVACSLINDVREDCTWYNAQIFSFTLSVNSQLATRTTRLALLFPCLWRKALNSRADSCCLRPQQQSTPHCCLVCNARNSCLDSCFSRLQQQRARIWWRCANYAHPPFLVCKLLTVSVDSIKNIT